MDHIHPLKLIFPSLNACDKKKGIWKFSIYECLHHKRLLVMKPIELINVLCIHLSMWHEDNLCDVLRVPAMLPWPLAKTQEKIFCFSYHARALQALTFSALQIFGLGIFQLKSLSNDCIKRVSLNKVGFKCQIQESQGRNHVQICTDSSKKNKAFGDPTVPWSLVERNSQNVRILGVQGNSEVWILTLQAVWGE